MKANSNSDPDIYDSRCSTNPAPPIEIPYGRQEISETDIRAVVDVLRSDFLTQGPAIPAFEKAIANYCNAKYGVAVNSATSALHLACLALDVGPGDYVWTSPITFVASANCAIYCGAQIDFVDIDPKTYNLSVRCLIKKLREAEKVGKLPKVVIPVHMCGQSCDMEAIYKLSEKYGFRIIEDASHAIGGKYQEAPVGNCRYSDITVFSFHPVKIITTGEGGMAMTNDSRLSEKMMLLRSHGITRKKERMTKKPEGPWYYQQLSLGFNYRTTDIQAALGLNQLRRIDTFVSQRQDIARRYNESLVDLPMDIPWRHPDCYSAMHLYVIRINSSENDDLRRKVFEGMRLAGIGVNLHYIPVYRQPFYEKLGFVEGYCPEAEQYYTEAISLPIFPSLEATQQDFVIEQISKLLMR